MPRNYIPKKKTYTNEDLEKAVRLIKEGKLSIRKASEQFRIDKSKLSRQINNKHIGKQGRRPALSKAKEEDLTSKIITMAEENENNIETAFKEGKPDNEWIRLFCERNDLSEKKMKELEQCTQQAKDTWDKLRRCYLNAINRRRSKASDVKRIPPWRFEHQMSFLLPYMKPRKNSLQESPQESLQEEETQLDLQNEELEESDCFVKVEHEVEDEAEIKMENFLDAGEELSNDFMSLEPDREEIDETPPFKKTKYQEQDDEDDMFFTSMFKMIKSLPPLEQAKIKLTLGNAVLQAKLKVREAENNASSQQPSPCTSSTT